MQKRLAITKIAMISAVLVGSLFVFLKPAASVTRVTVADDGKEIFAAKCAKCHGADGKGNSGMKERGGPDFTNADWQKKHTDAEITALVENGKGRSMPSWKGKISDDEIKGVVAYVRSLSGQ